jgi:DNA-binding LacI/PurR family transcriptional regulator
MSREPGRRVTSSDVAKKAGVSRATVSYVVNDVTDIRLTPETRARVLAAAAELGYSQYGPGRTLKSGRSDVVLFVLNDLPVGHALNSLLDELEAKLAENGLSLVIYRVGSRGNPVSRIWREIGPCAVIAMDAIDDRDAGEIRTAGVAVLRLNLRGGDEPGALIQSQTDVGAAQVRYLAERGHRRLGFAYPDDPRVESFASPRLEGARSAARELGLPDLDVRTIPLDPTTASIGVRPWTKPPRPISAICAYNDNVAFAVLAGLRHDGVAVPDEIAVIGVDNDPTGALVSPSLTTIDTRHVEVADELARLVTAGRTRPVPSIRAVPQPYSVIVRESA